MRSPDQPACSFQKDRVGGIVPAGKLADEAQQFAPKVNVFRRDRALHSRQDVAGTLLELIRAVRVTRIGQQQCHEHGPARRQRTGKVQAVIVAKLDRLTRSVKDLCGLLELFEKRNVALISVAESLDTSSAAGRLVITIMGAVSQWEREAIGERTREALRYKRNNGERVGNIEFGYRLAADGCHLEPHPEEQAALVTIRKLRSKGHSLRCIAAALNRQGHRTRRSSEWRLESVVRVLRRESPPPSSSKATPKSAS